MKNLKKKKPGYDRCLVCEKDFLYSDPQTFDFGQDKVICKRCWLLVYNKSSWGSKREERIIIEYKKVSIPHSLKWEIWERDNFTCKNCGDRKNLSIDHIKPESLGGTLEKSNLQTLCRSCNSSKNNRYE